MFTRVHYAVALFAISLMSFLLGLASAPVVDAIGEGSKVYGTDLTDKPWDQMACLQIASAIESNIVLRDMGARKSKVLEYMRERIPPDARGEALRELSLAWDKGTSPEDFVMACFAKIEAYRNQRPKAQS